MNQHFDKVRKKLFINLAVNWLVPLVIVILLRNIYPNDAVALSIAGAIPAVKTLFMLVWRRKIDWIALLGVLGFAGAFVISTLSGGSSLPLKLYHPIVTGIIGLIFVGSAAIGKPVLVIILQVFMNGGTERFRSMESRKKLGSATILVGSVLVIEAGIHIIMAYTLSTVAYLSMSRIVTLTAILVLIASRKFLVKQNNYKHEEVAK